MIERLILPFPPTQNKLYANRNGGRFTTKRYNTWKNAAAYDLQAHRKAGKAADRCSSHYTLHIVLDCQKRCTVKDGRLKAMDVDNYSKAVSDFLVEQGLVTDDRYCESVLIKWGYVEKNKCSVTVTPTMHVAMPAGFREAAE